MAYKTIGQLDAASSVESADLVEIEQSGLSKQASVDLLLNNEARLISASGIKFPSSAVSSVDANTLDDYEENTWVPGISFGGGTTGITYLTQSGYYTKIGNRVFINGQVALSSNGSSSGVALITGLPFVASSYSAVSFRINNITYTGMVQGVVNAGANTIALNYIPETGSSANLTETNLSDTANIIFSAVYKV